VRDKRLTIVAITAGATTDDVQRCYDSGMDEVITKPFKVSTLRSVIVKYARNEPPEPVAMAAPVNGVDPGEY
jgi:CheY-like chemotaxis protein